jgi:hypothetical protein
VTRDDALAAYQKHSTRASDVARQLAFAGFGVAWVFRTPGGQIPEALRPATLYFGLALAADLAQYVFATAVWGIFHRWKEHNRVKVQFEAPLWMNAPAVMAFWVKLGLLAFGYVGLVTWLAR